jgi:transcriptional regulator with XRE-family HTH domain
LDRGLLQKEAAAILGVSEAAVQAWESGTRNPRVKVRPRILEFLGYDPLPAPTTEGDQLRKWRESQGLFRRELAGQIGVDESAITNAELREEEKGDGEGEGGWYTSVQIP